MAGMGYSAMMAYAHPHAHPQNPMTAHQQAQMSNHPQLVMGTHAGLTAHGQKQIQSQAQTQAQTSMSGYSQVQGMVNAYPQSSTVMYAQTATNGQASAHLPLHYSHSPAMLQAQQEWRRIEHQLRHMRLDRSPVVPRSFEEYVKHQEEYTALRMAQERSKLTARIEDARSQRLEGRSAATLAFGGRRFEDGRHGVLGNPTIWMPHWTPTATHPQAPWPSLEELREEGDERHTSQFNRHLPLPRMPAPDPSISWRQCRYVEPYPFDRVQHVWRQYPTIRLPGDPHISEPEYDAEGDPIDDPDDHGRVASIRPSGSVFGGETLSDASTLAKVVSDEMSMFPDVLSMDMLPQTPLSDNSVKSNFAFNPAVRDFVSRRRSSGSATNVTEHSLERDTPSVTALGVTISPAVKTGASKQISSQSGSSSTRVSPISKAKTHISPSTIKANTQTSPSTIKAKTQTSPKLIKLKTLMSSSMIKAQTQASPSVIKAGSNLTETTTSLQQLALADVQKIFHQNAMAKKGSQQQTAENKPRLRLVTKNLEENSQSNSKTTETHQKASPVLQVQTLPSLEAPEVD